jgi:hypothetical protein
MANISGLDEKTVRAAVKSFIESLNCAGHVFSRRRSITSREHFARALGKASIDSKVEIQFLEIEFLQFVDLDASGGEDCPGASIVYGLHLFKQFVDSRSDSTNSDDEFTAAVFKLREGFLNFHDFGAAVGEPITQPEYANFGNDSLTDCKGHSVDLLLTVNYTEENEG